MTGAPHAAVLQCRSLRVVVAERTLVSDLELSVAAGDVLSILGPNGVGKTLTLHALAGLRPVASGSVHLAGSDIARQPRPAIARRLGLLLQSQDDAFPLTVAEAVRQGAFARTPAWRWDAGIDAERRARDALIAMDLSGFEDRLAASLSGGERRRLALATLLVQDPEVLLLDEPLNHLDPAHQRSLLGRLQRLADSGKAIVTTLHDPFVAARLGGRVLMLSGDGGWSLGAAADMCTPDRLERLYGTRFETWHRDGARIALPAIT